MSLEAALAENTAAMKALTAALAKGGNGKSAGDAAIEKEAARATTATAAGKPAAAAMTAEKFATSWTDWLAGAGDDDEAEIRKTAIRATSKHFGLKKISDAGKDQWPELLAVLKTLKAGDTPDFMGGGDGESPI